MTSNTNLTVDLQRPNIAVVAYGVQGDSLSRKLTLTLIDGDKPWTPPTGALPVVRYGKPDGTFGFYDTLENGAAAISITGNTATVTLAAQALTASGNVAMQLNFYTAAAEKLSSFAWILRVDPAVVEDGKIESTDYVSTLTEALAKAMELLPEIEKSGEYAKTASDAAEAAEQSKTAAAGSASAAAGSATAAGAAAQSASASQQAASASATAAGQAASSADASKAAAEQSAVGAAEDKDTAAQSAEDAEAWAIGKRNGVPVPETDPTYHNNAEYYKEQAKIITGGGVQSINGKTPDAAGDVDLAAADVGAVAVINSAGAHNAIYRGKNLGTSVTAEQYASIANGSFEDLYIGDYWEIGGVTYRIAACDYYFGTGNVEPLATHHVVVMPDTPLYNAPMNDSNITTGGYAGAKMRTSGLIQANQIIDTAFDGHILSHRIYVSNTITNGKPSGGIWVDSTVDLPNEQMLYGGPVFMPMPDGTPISNYLVEKSQLPLFSYRADLIFAAESCWLRDVVSDTGFARINNTGLSSYGPASTQMGVRPAFCVYGGD